MATRESAEYDADADVMRTTFATEESVYGVLLVAGLIVASGATHSTSWQLFWTIVVTVAVFWMAHVYAGTVARHGLDHDRVLDLGESFRAALKRSWGLLASAFVPLAILLLGAAEVVPDAVAIWSALWAGIAVLAALGYLAFLRRGASLPVRLLGAVVTAGFGLLMMLLKAIVTH